MAENKILPWAQTGTANVLSDADYASDVASGGLYGDGVKSGQASSRQANKTWRQATAPGAGLGQFLVDNLSVDVTDADTPATFSTRIANAVLKLAQISPFNQAWATATGGYRKYAIVSDSSGNFWVSTADQNTTTPGADGAKWQNLFNGYATQAWAEGKFQPAGDYATHSDLSGYLKNANGGIGGEQSGTSLVYQISAERPFFAYNNNHDGGNLAWYSDVVGEATARANADSNLQNQINGKQATGNYVSADVSGAIIETFTATVTGNNQTIQLPRNYSNVIFVAPQNGTDGRGFGMTNVNSWTNSTANVSVASYHTGAPQGATITQTFLVIAVP